MRFINFNGIQKNIPTSVVSVRGAHLDLHNEWNFIGYVYELSSNRFIMRWRDARIPESFCQFEFSDVYLVRIEPRDAAYPRDAAQVLSMMIYQEPEGELPFIKFWFEDQSTLEIAADGIASSFYTKEQPVIPELSTDWSA